MCCTKASGSAGTPKALPSLPGRSRRETTHEAEATSRGPTSTRTGTPCSTHRTPW